MAVKVRYSIRHRIMAPYIWLIRYTADIPTRACIPEGSQGGTAERDHRHYPFGRGVRSKGRGSCDAKDAAYVLD